MDKQRPKLKLYEPGDRVRGKGVMAGEMGTVAEVLLFFDASELRPILVKWDRYKNERVNAKEIEFVSHGKKAG